MASTEANIAAPARLPRRRLANAVRALAMDAVEAARSGHPGMPMGMADIAEVLWNDYLRHNPANPRWCDRDRFVLSNGHGSMLIYALAHLSGYPLEIDEIRQFRQLGQRTAGHPERDLDIAIETTTGPLGQGLANAVGMGPGGKGSRGDVQPAGRHDRRPPHLRFSGRRLPDGRHLPRGVLVGRHAGAGQADRRLRRQRYFHRRRDRWLVHRRYPGAVSRLRLARGGRSRRA